MNKNLPTYLLGGLILATLAIVIAASYYEPAPAEPTLTFEYHPTPPPVELGTLYFDDELKQFVFEGDLDASAEAFLLQVRSSFEEHCLCDWEVVDTEAGWHCWKSNEPPVEEQP